MTTMYANRLKLENISYIKIIKTKDYVVAKYYFLLIIKTIERVIYNYDVC